MDHLDEGAPKYDSLQHFSLAVVVDNRGLEDLCADYATWRSQPHSAAARCTPHVGESLATLSMLHQMHFL